jgi:hypothetical protein
MRIPRVVFLIASGVMLFILAIGGAAQKPAAGVRMRIGRCSTGILQGRVFRL